MAESPVVLLAFCIGLPLGAALLNQTTKDRFGARNIAIGAVSITLLLLLEVLRRVLTSDVGHAVSALLMADRLNTVPMILFAGIALVTLLTAPRRDVDSGFVANVLVLTSSTIAAYGAANLLVFLAAWTAPLLPYAFRVDRRSRYVLATSTLVLSLAVFLIALSPAPLSVTEGLAAERATSGFLVLGLLALAAALRQFIFPFHRTAIALFEGHGLSVSCLFLNSHLGIFLLARFVMPSLAGVAAEVLTWLGALALFTSLYTAVLGIAEREPRRVFALLFVSQSSAMIAGMATTSHEGIAGAFLQWLVLGVSSTVLIAVYRSLEVRVHREFGGDDFMGLASSMPRLAVFFAVVGLTVVGLPGTLGFAGEDLLLHGVLAGYSWWGAALPIAIALNAYHVFRLFARLFLGKDDVTRDTASDALPRERWALSACLVVLVWGGIVPHQLVSVQAPAVGFLAQTEASASDLHP
jgi:NADH-quinone oxidoreductase subunit M